MLSRDLLICSIIVNFTDITTQPFFEIYINTTFTIKSRSCRLDQWSLPYRLRCRQIGEGDIPAVTVLLARGFRKRNRKFWERGLDSLGNVCRRRLYQIMAT